MSTSQNFEILTSFSVLEFDHLYSDAHCPLTLELKIRGHYTEINPHNKITQSVPEIKLRDESKKSLFIGNLNTDEISTINAFLEEMSLKENIEMHDVNKVVSSIEALFFSASKTTFGLKRGKRDPHSYRQNKHMNKKWSNQECRNARNTYHYIRKQYNMYKTVHYKNRLKKRE